MNQLLRLVHKSNTSFIKQKQKIFVLKKCHQTSASIFKLNSIGVIIFQLLLMSIICSSSLPWKHQSTLVVTRPWSSRMQPPLMHPPAILLHHTGVNLTWGPSHGSTLMALLQTIQLLTPYSRAGMLKVTPVIQIQTFAGMLH